MNTKTKNTYSYTYNDPLPCCEGVVVKKNINGIEAEELEETRHSETCEYIKWIEKGFKV